MYTYLTGTRSQGKNWFGVIIVAFQLAKDKSLNIDCAPNYASIIQRWFPHINLIKDGPIFIASFPACDR